MGTYLVISRVNTTTLYLNIELRAALLRKCLGISVSQG